MTRTRHADFSPQDRGDVGRHRKLQARGSVPGSGGLKSACRFMGSVDDFSTCYRFSAAGPWFVRKGVRVAGGAVWATRGVWA